VWLTALFVFALPIALLIGILNSGAPMREIAIPTVLVILFVLLIWWFVDIYHRVNSTSQALAEQEAQLANFHEMLRQIRRIIRLRELE